MNIIQTIFCVLLFLIILVILDRITFSKEHFQVVSPPAAIPGANNLVLTDENGNFTWVNESFIRLTKRSLLDLTGNKWKNIIEESSRDSIFDHWDRAIKEKRNFEETLIIVDKKGRKFSAMCVAVIQQDNKYIGSFFDVKELEPS